MGIFDPQGLSSSPSTQSITTSNINSWAQPYVNNYLNQGNALLNQPITPMMQQAYDQISNLQTPGQFAQGTNFLNQAAQGQLGTTGTALGYGSIGNTYGGSAQLYGMTAGQKYTDEATNAAKMQAYMNPYVQNALAPQLELLNQQQALGAQGIASKAAGQGAFGGNRATLAQGLNAQNYALAQQKALGEGYNTAFNQARQAQQFGSTLGLDAVMRGNQVGIQGAQTGLQGIQGAQQGYAGATQAGVGLGNIGAQQNQADLARIGLLNTIANQQYDLPFKRLNFMQGLMSGLPVSSSTTQGYQAGQNKALQAVGALGSLASYAPGLINAGGSLLSGAKNIWNWANSGSGVSDATQAARDASGTAGINSGNPAIDIGTGAYPTNPDGSIDYSGGGWGTGAGTDWSIYNQDVANNGFELPNLGPGWMDGYPETFDSSMLPTLNAKGGQIKEKRYASGGIASIDRKVLNNPTDYSAQTINRGAQNNLFGDVTKLLALDTIAKQKQAMQNQQAMQQQAKPPVLAQLQQQAMMQQMPQGMPQQMPQGMPQQMAQAMPQGIDSARSNLPRQYAGGGIIAFNEGGSAFSEDIEKLKKWAGEGWSTEKPQWFQDIQNYFTPRSGKVIEDESNRGVVTPEQKKFDSTIPGSGVPSDIVIHDTPKGPRGPAAPAAPTVPTAAYKPAETSGIDALTKRYEDMIRGGEDFKEAEKKAETTAMRNLFLNMMNPEKGASFVSGLGAAGKEAQAGLEKTTEAIQARKDKQIGQLVALGLKGQDLKNEAQKLGISEAELQAKLPLYSSEVAKNLATAKYIASGKGKSAGKIASATAYKILEKYNGYKDPKTAPAHILNQLDPQTKKALTLPGTESYNRAMIEYNKLLQQEMANEIGMLQAIGGGSTSSLVD